MPLLLHLDSVLHVHLKVLLQRYGAFGGLLLHFEYFLLGFIVHALKVSVHRVEDVEALHDSPPYLNLFLMEYERSLQLLLKLLA